MIFLLTALSLSVMGPSIMLDPNALADAKAQVKRLIAQQLATLPQQAQADVLADLRLAVVAGELVGKTDKHQPPTKTTKPPPQKGVRRAPMKGLRPGTKATSVYNTLKAHPRMALRELAKAVYGDEGATRKLRAVLFSLKGQGLVRSAGHGLWEAVG